MLTQLDRESRSLTLYAPYWFINRTGMDLQYKDRSSNETEVVHCVHRSDYSAPFLFSFNTLANSTDKVTSDSHNSDSHNSSVKIYPLITGPCLRLYEIS